jgi:hypothetical protein
LGQVTIPSDADTPASGTSKATEIKKLRDQNDSAYEALILLIDGDTAEGRVAFNLVKGSKTTELKDGDAALAWKRLSDKFEPKSAPTCLELKNQFHSLVLKNANSDPDIWITDLFLVQNH